MPIVLHLAENADDPERPFAFLASLEEPPRKPGGNPTRRRLLAAARELADAGDAAGLAGLLAPLHDAAGRLPWLRELVDAQRVYHPLAFGADEALAFLKGVGAMRQAGLEARLPDWWKKRPKAKVDVKIGNTASRVGAESLLDFDALLTLGDATLTAEEAEELLAGADVGETLVLLKGRWAAVDAEQLREAVRRLQALEKQNLDGLTLLAAMRMLGGPAGRADAEEDGDGEPWLHAAAGDGEIVIDATQFTVLSTLTGTAATVIRRIDDSSTHETTTGNDANGDGLNDGYDGLGYLDPNGGKEDKASFVVDVAEAGTYTFAFRMAANSDRPIAVKTGDQSVAITGTNTTSFTNWTDFPITLTLVKGANTVVIEQTGGSGPNIDSVRVTPLSVADTTADAGGDLAITLIDATDPSQAVFEVTGDDDDITAFSVVVNGGAAQAVTPDEQGRFTLDLKAFTGDEAVTILTSQMVKCQLSNDPVHRSADPQGGRPEKLPPRRPPRRGIYGDRPVYRPRNRPARTRRRPHGLAPPPLPARGGRGRSSRRPHHHPQAVALLHQKGALQQRNERLPYRR